MLATFRRDGRVQQSPVTAGVDGEGRVIISVTEDRAKTRNARRDPRVSLCVFNDAFYGRWVQVEGTAEFADGEDRLDALVDYYRRLSGEHSDWAEYRAAMERDPGCCCASRSSARPGSESGGPPARRGTHSGAPRVLT